MTRRWIAYAALTITVTQLAALLVSGYVVGPSAVNLGVAVGLGWAALSPRTMRWIGRRVR